MEHELQWDFEGFLKRAAIKGDLRHGIETATNYYQKLYFHKLGTPQSEDKLVYERRDEKEWGFDGHVTLELGNMATLPILLWPGMKVGQLCVIQMSGPAEHP